MLYEFDDLDTGERVSVFFRVADAPSLGEVRTIGGRRLRRVPSALTANVRRYPDAGPSDAIDPGSPTWTGPVGPDGRAIATTRDKREWAKRETDAGRPTTYHH